MNWRVQSDWRQLHACARAVQDREGKGARDWKLESVKPSAVMRLSVSELHRQLCIHAHRFSPHLCLCGGALWLCSCQVQ